MDTQDLISLKDAAGHLQLHPVTLARFFREGRIGAYRIGRKLFFSHHHIDQYLKRVEVRPKREAQI